MFCHLFISSSFLLDFSFCIYVSLQFYVIIFPFRLSNSLVLLLLIFLCSRFGVYEIVCRVWDNKKHPAVRQRAEVRAVGSDQR
jgi:hypothetical protein